MLTFLLVTAFGIYTIGCGEEEWCGRIRMENGVKLIENSESGIWSSKRIDLVQDFILGNENDPQQSFYRIRAVEVSVDGRIYILDAGNLRIVTFDNDGKFLFELGGVGSGPGEFRQPIDMTLDEKSNIYILDRSSFRVSKFDGSGRYLDSKKLETFASGLDVLSEDIVLVTETRMEQFGAFAQLLNLENKRIEFNIELPYKFDPDVTSGGISLDEKYQFLQDEKIYLAVPFPYEIRRYSATGQLEMRILKEDSRISAPEIKSRRGGRSRSIKENGKAGPCFLTHEGMLVNNCTWFTLEDNRIETKTAIDFFNNQGQYLGSIELPNSQKLVATDQLDNLYLLEQEPFERVIRVHLKK